MKNQIDLMRKPQTDRQKNSDLTFSGLPKGKKHVEEVEVGTLSSKVGELQDIVKQSIIAAHDNKEYTPKYTRRVPRKYADSC